MSNTIKSIYGKQYDYDGLANKPDLLELDPELSEEGKAADAAAVGARFDALPTSVDDEGYTDISGLRQPTKIDIVKQDNIITLTTTLQGSKERTSIITLNDSELPINISMDDGTECTISWEGF